MFDDLPPVRVDNLVWDGKRIRFSVVRGDHRADYNGILVDANSIDGKVTVTEGSRNNEYVWKAECDEAHAPASARTDEARGLRTVKMAQVSEPLPSERSAALPLEDQTVGRRVSRAGVMASSSPLRPPGVPEKFSHATVFGLIQCAGGMSLLELGQLVLRC